MPLCTIHLLALHHTNPNPFSTFLSTLKSLNLSPLIVSRVIRWIILPTNLSIEHLLARNISWELFIILPNTSPFPPPLEQLVQHHWFITAGVPSRLLQDFECKNKELLHPHPSSVPKLSTTNTKRTTTTSSQNLELSAGLESWIQSLGEKEKGGAVSMFNLLAFNAGTKDAYLKYGAAFAKSIGSRHGGNAKIVGNVIANSSSTPSVSSTSNSPDTAASATDASADGWDEIALAHYPSILHFREMLISEDYQEVNHKYRVGSLRDTCILMTSELAVEELVQGSGGGAKL